MVSSCGHKRNLGFERKPHSSQGVQSKLSQAGLQNVFAWCLLPGGRRSCPPGGARGVGHMSWRLAWMLPGPAVCGQAAGGSNPASCV